MHQSLFVRLCPYRPQTNNAFRQLHIYPNRTFPSKPENPINIMFDFTRWLRHHSPVLAALTVSVF